MQAFYIMSRFYSYLNTTASILEQYKGETPLAVFLKQFFAANKKYGSKDRRQIASLCYDYFRLGHTLKDMPLEEKLLTATFLCENQPSVLLENLRPEWNSLIGETLAVKKTNIGESFNEADIFPFVNDLSEGMDQTAFAASFLHQPKLFLRLRPGQENLVKAKLKAISMPFENMGKNAIALANGARADEEIVIDKEAVIQDYNSQQIGELLRPLMGVQNTGTASRFPIQVWDCCAASGGKSIMLYDLNPNIRLLVSDIRQSILHNLQNRFQRAGIQQYQKFVVDLAAEEVSLPMGNKFNMILADVPCTGSGTWARTPEQLYFFNSETITTYAERQRKIISHVIPRLQNGGHLVYITCSVFKQENEETVNAIVKEHGVELVSQQLLKGYHDFADTMFLAVLKK